MLPDISYGRGLFDTTVCSFGFDLGGRSNIVASIHIGLRLIDSLNICPGGSFHFIRKFMLGYCSHILL